MGKSFSAMQYLSTTGAGIAIGTNGILFGGFIRGSDLAGTIIIKDGATVLFTNSATGWAFAQPPIALRGPVTMTSSAGDHFVVLFVDV